ncbi:MAG: ABC transporter substrate-binding protein [Scytonema sp. PMC 1070.18]|nr:ABC transporter substrate-binding protein [Scytonema sp. PMC 1070.18]
MSQKNSIKYITRHIAALIISGLIVLSIISLLRGFGNQNPFKIIKTVPTPSTGLTVSNQQVQISFGDKVLIKKEESETENTLFQEAKRRGVQAMAASNYTEAVAEFEKAIQHYRNAPETLIYLNNARIGNNKSYTIAIATPISDDADSALKMLRGIAQAQDEINQMGGINSVPLKVVIADDAGQPEIAKQIASKLTENKNILAVVGHHSSGATLAAREIYESEKLVAISSTSTSVELSEPSATSSTRYVFRTVPNDSIAAKALANYMLTRLKKRKVAVFYDPKSRYSKSLKKEFLGEVIQNQGEVVDEFEFSEKEQDFDAYRYVKRAIDRGAEVLMLASPYDKLKQALSVININDNRLQLLGGDDIYDIRILQEGRSRATGMIIAMAWHIDANLNSVFVSNSRKLWNADVDWKTAMTYDASQALIAALKRNPTRIGVQEAFSSSDFQTPGVSNTIRFLGSSGDRLGPIQLVQVKEIPDSKQSRSHTGFDFVPVGE